MQQKLFIHSQLLATHGDNLILPNTAIAEIVHYSDPEPTANAPQWLLGMLVWRGLKIPLLSFEIVNGKEMPKPTNKNSVAVLNCLGGNDTLRFFAIVVQVLPHLIKVEKRNIAATASEKTNSFITETVVINDTPAIIPNLDALEEMIAKQGIKVTQEN